MYLTMLSTVGAADFGHRGSRGCGLEHGISALGPHGRDRPGAVVATDGRTDGEEVEVQPDLADVRGARADLDDGGRGEETTLSPLARLCGQGSGCLRFRN